MSDPLRDEYVEALEAENDALRARVRDLEKIVGFRNAVPIIFGLTGSESKVLSMLMEREFASKQQLLSAVMADRGADEEPEIKIVDVYICKIRTKIKKFGVDIDTLWGRGYRLDPANKAKVATYLKAESSSEAAE